jgi:hypothetical protein
MEWLSMDLAPKDGSKIELLVNSRIRPGFWSSACVSWMVVDESGGVGECFPDAWRLLK